MYSLVDFFKEISTQTKARKRMRKHLLGNFGLFALAAGGIGLVAFGVMEMTKTSESRKSKEVTKEAQQEVVRQSTLSGEFALPYKVRGEMEAGYISSLDFRHSGDVVINRKGIFPIDARYECVPIQYLSILIPDLHPNIKEKLFSYNYIGVIRWENRNKQNSIIFLVESVNNKPIVYIYAIDFKSLVFPWSGNKEGFFVHYDVPMRLY